MVYTKEKNYILYSGETVKIPIKIYDDSYNSFNLSDYKIDGYFAVSPYSKDIYKKKIKCSVVNANDGKCEMILSNKLLKNLFYNFYFYTIVIKNKFNLDDIHVVQHGKFFIHHTVGILTPEENIISDIYFFDSIKNYTLINSYLNDIELEDSIQNETISTI